MAEPTSSAGVSLTILAVAVFGPMAGPWALIIISALIGAMWPLSATTTETRVAGAWLLLRCTTTSLVLTGLLASLLDRYWQVSVNQSLAPVAFFIGALGNGWRPVFDAAAGTLSSVLGRAGGRQP